MNEAADDRYRSLLQRSLAEGRALPAECYRDPELFTVELDRVLRPQWHAVARWDSLPNPGDYQAVDLYGEPLVVVRDTEKRLRVFSRVCRHRAHPIVEGTGNAKRLQCPYHRWSYDLDGKLAQAPLMEGTPGFDPARCALPELHCEMWQGFLMTTTNAGASSFRESLPKLEEALAPHSFDELVSIGTLDFDSPWNWKVMVDNFMESYHHMGPHAGSLQRTNPAADTFCPETGEAWAFIENPGIGDAPSFRVFQAFPTLLFFISQGPLVFGAWYEMQIDRHDRFDLRIHLLTSPALAATEEAVALMQKQSRAIHLEDIPVCEAVQRGISSDLWRPGHLSSQEACLAAFQRHLAQKIE